MRGEERGMEKRGLMEIGRGDEGKRVESRERERERERVRGSE